MAERLVDLGRAFPHRKLIESSADGFLRCSICKTHFWLFTGAQFEELTIMCRYEDHWEQNHAVIH